MSDNMVSVNIKGLAEIQKKLEELKGPTASKATRKALKDGAKLVEDEMVAVVPKDSGFLSENIDSRITTKDGGTIGKAYIGPKGKVYYPGRDAMFSRLTGRRLVSTGKHPTAGAQIPAVSVARFLEFGDGRRTPNPFMSIAFKTKSQAALEAIISAFKNAFKI